MSFFRISSSLALLGLLAACADKMPVPGGTSTENMSCFGSVPEMKSRLADLHKGMKEEEVLQRLCPSTRRSGVRLERRDIRIALLGGDNIPFSAGDEPDSEIIRDLYGFKVTYRDVKHKLGFTSPIRIRTDESGFLYTITLVFRDGTLFEDPILTGGPVNNSKSDTIFESLTPGAIIDHAVP